MSDEKRFAALELKVGEEARLRAMMDKDQADLRIELDSNTRRLDRLQTDVAELKAGQLVLVDKLDELMRRTGR
jgi:polyhydroxyalkanoate synthesis regulator phasin